MSNEQDKGEFTATGTHRAEAASWAALNRRAFLGQYAGSLGGLALASLLGSSSRRLWGSEDADSPGSRRPAKAKSVICLFQHGGPSQMDLFDPKPTLTKFHGMPYPGELDIHFAKQAGNLLASPFKFAPRGASGIELSELLPHTAEVIDDLLLVRSMKTFTVDHEAALRLIHNGKAQLGRPTWGSWVLYALGSENHDLPSYVVLGDPDGLPIDGVRNWTSGWLPALYQGTPFLAGPSPVLNLKSPEGMTPDLRSRQMELLAKLNANHQLRHPENNELTARIANFEMAGRMQSAVPEVLDFADESEETRQLYGLDRDATAEYGRRCLLARRLVEKGVRFVQVFLSGQPWDTHDKNADKLRGLCARTDQPSAALVKDLKRRGLLESTIVMWAGEFGRLPVSQGSDGRDHNGHGFSLWLAGGGFRGGYAHGATDDFGYKATTDVVTVHDLHATLLEALGLDHVRLTYPHDGREDSLTDHEVTKARVIRELLA
ncbi:MAG: DUF1501 domain-containing protein [Planctomycetaceae bacterium]|nr:DUF1501 domain-containing protein [Planctomycetaceae bacterium]